MLNVNQNDNLGYGKNITKNNIIAVISVGYADGIPRKLSKIVHVVIGGKCVE
ncbi:MAG: hypothetical protein J6T74_07075 [Clostridia bacterium]|nr:hypothetical protein [Clostridia bacterium]